MNTEAFKSLLQEWHARCSQRDARTRCQLELIETDLLKLDALAATFGLDRDEVATQLLHLAIQEVEEKMPYVPGTKVIRIEEGDEIYEDLGPMPRYIAMQEKLRKKTKKTN